MSKRIGLRHIPLIFLKKIGLVPSANNYDNLIGTIWSLFYGGYDFRSTGEISVADPSNSITPQWGGCYDKR